MVTKFMRLSIKGTLPGGEVWSVNPIFARYGLINGTLDYAGALQRVVAASNVVVPATLTDSMGGVANTKITEFTLEGRTAEGVLEVAASALKTIGGTGSTNAHPAQSAVVCSLRTNTPGASGRGRLYWPAIGRSIDAATLRMASATVGSMATSFNDYLSQLGNAINIGEIGTWGKFQLSVWSRARKDFYVVERLMVGDVIDTQRRRRDALPENYQTVPYTG